MIQKNKLFYIVLLFIFSVDLYSQNDTLYFEDYIRNLIRYHPDSEQAELNLKLSDAKWKTANGLFDPILNADYDDKYFDDKQYFQVFKSNIKLPSYLGLTFNAGYDNTRGLFLNPENNTPLDGLGYLGIEANLLQGLFIDERRTATNQAEIFEELAKNTRQIQINVLIMEASAAYFQWQAATEYQSILEESVNLAREYFLNNRESFLLGDKPAIDTLESFLVLQDQIVMLQSNSLNVIKSKNNLKNYIWQDNRAETVLNSIPARVSSYEEYKLTNDSLTYTSNPILEEKRQKRELLLTENELKREKLKPKLKVKYNALTSEVNNNIPTFNINNYKWGLNFSMPLLFRSEIGDVEINELKIKETELDIANKENTLRNKQLNNSQALEYLRTQIEIVKKNVNRYKQLLELERQKFELGESSVFIINKRQEKYIMSKLKVIDLTVKYNIEVIYNLYLTNKLEQSFK